MLSASNFHAKTNIIICKEENIKDREKSEMIMAALLMENILKQTFPVVHYKTLQLLIVNYQAAEKCQYWGSVQERSLSLNLAWFKKP